MSYAARRVGMAAVRTSLTRAPAIYPGRVARASLATFKIPTVNNDVNVSCGERDLLGGARG